jgi:hypothetical protein
MQESYRKVSSRTHSACGHFRCRRSSAVPILSRTIPMSRVPTDARHSLLARLGEGERPLQGRWEWRRSRAGRAEPGPQTAVHQLVHPQ